MMKMVTCFMEMDFPPKMSLRYALPRPLLPVTYLSQQWWRQVITPKLTELATTGDNELYFAFLVCGTLLLKDTTRKAITDIIAK